MACWFDAAAAAPVAIGAQGRSLVPRRAARRAGARSGQLGGAAPPRAARGGPWAGCSGHCRRPGASPRGFAAGRHPPGPPRWPWERLHATHWALEQLINSAPRSWGRGSAAGGHGALRRRDLCGRCASGGAGEPRGVPRDSGVGVAPGGGRVNRAPRSPVLADRRGGGGGWPGHARAHHKRQTARPAALEPTRGRATRRGTSNGAISLAPASASALAPPPTHGRTAIEGTARERTASASLRDAQPPPRPTRPSTP
jgi:hypothetical protein